MHPFHLAVHGDAERADPVQEGGIVSQELDLIRGDVAAEPAQETVFVHALWVLGRRAISRTSFM
jgi:hypothetical protein